MHVAAGTFRKNILNALPVICFIVGTALAVYTALSTVKPRISPLKVASLNIKELETVDLRAASLNKHKIITKYPALRDPFVLPQRAKIADEPLPQLRLTMIIINSRQKMCKVNGRLYAEGESGPDFKVSFIGESGVLVERKGKEQWLFLTKNS